MGSSQKVADVYQTRKVGEVHKKNTFWEKVGTVIGCLVLGVIVLGVIASQGG